MAKRKKMQDQNPPRRVEIRGQDHLLAYITPEEAQLLMANGGSGEAGPMGIPAFAEADGDDDDVGGDPGDGGGIGGDDVGTAGGPGGGSSGGGDFSGGGRDVSNTAARAAEKDFATEKAAMEARGFDVGSPASRAMEKSFALGFNQMQDPKGPTRGMGYNVSGREANVALGQIADRMAMAKAGYNLPGPLGILGMIAGKMAQQNLSRIQDNILAGYPAAFDKQGQVQGAWGPGLFDGTMAYSGNPVEGNPGTGWSDDTMGGDGYDDLTVRPVNPETGQCEPGYKPDPDMAGFCRLDTGGVIGGGVLEDTSVPGTYARMGLLDVTPTGLPEFYEQYGIPSQDFDEANLAYRRGTGTQFGIFQDPYDREGFSRLI